MKTAKKFMISLAFLTPVVLLTPTLLASCSYIATDKKLDSEEANINHIANWEVLKANDTYVQKDSDSNTTPVYLFKSGTTKDVYSIKDATESMKKLVTNSIYAGNVLDVKTKRASETIASDFEKITSSDSSKSTYVKRDFDLANQANFDLINQFITKQKFTNVYSNSDNKIEGDTYLGESIWFVNNKFQSISKILKCDVYVSLTETGNKSENIQYTIKFSFTTKTKQNWPNKNDNHPIEFEIQFETKNFLSLFKENDINVPKRLPDSYLEAANSVIPFHAGKLSKKSLDSSKPLSLDDVINYFANDDTKAVQHQGAYLTLLDSQINAAKVSQAFLNFNASNIINDMFDFKNDLSKFHISKDKLSLPYILGTDNSTISTNKPIFAMNDGAYIYRIDLKNKSFGADIIEFRMKHRSKNYKWFWGNWDEISNPYNCPSKNYSGFSDFEIWFRMKVID